MVSLEGIRVLFADDETYNMRGTIDALENAGATVEVKTDGTEVLEYLRAHRTNLPDLLILDIMMPKGIEIKTKDEGRSTGVAVYKWMQTEKIRIPTVVSTVVSDSSILQIFHDHNIPIVEKPYRFDELEYQIQKVLNERGKQ
jgi:CheY-like chemotaxis protein